MTKTALHTEDAPAAVGPYVQATQAGDFVYLSGQLAIDPATGTFMGDLDVTGQTELVFKNLKAVLASANITISDVVRAEIFLTDMADYAAVNAVYASTFEGVTPPARQCVAVAGLPLGGKVEISFIAYKPQQ